VAVSVARAVVSATGCRVADVSMVMLLALLESSRAGCGTAAGALEAVATGAGLLTGAGAAAFAGVTVTGAGVGGETPTTGFARGASGAAAIAGFGCGAGALYATGAGAGCSTLTGALSLEAGFEFLAIPAVVVGGAAAATGAGATATGATATEESVTVGCGAGWLGGTGVATTAGGVALATATGALACAPAETSTELPGARVPRRAAKAAAADSTSLGFSTGAGGSADFGKAVSST